MMLWKRTALTKLLHDSGLSGPTSQHIAEFLITQLSESQQHFTRDIFHSWKTKTKISSTSTFKYIYQEFYLLLEYDVYLAYFVASVPKIFWCFHGV